MSSTRSRIGYITFINCIAAIAVLILHTNSCFWDFSSTEFYWKTANIIESVFYFSVPLFFMNTGITLMDLYERNTLKQYFMKRLKKAVIPFIGWNFVGVLFYIVVGALDPARVNLRYLYQGITGTSIVNIYWFFTSLFAIYLCMPLYAAVAKDKRRTVFTYLVTAGFILNTLLPFLRKLSGMDFNLPLKVPVSADHLIWPLLGWLLANTEFTKKQKSVIYTLGFAGLMTHILGTYYASMNAGEVIQTFKGYANVPNFFYSIAVFVLLKALGTKIMDTKAEEYITCLSTYTFPIYMMQFIPLYIFPRLHLLSTRSLLYRLGAPFIMIPIMMTVTWVMRRIPLVKHLVP